jgi:hypothetical protein
MSELNYTWFPREGGAWQLNAGANHWCLIIHCENKYYPEVGSLKGIVALEKIFTDLNKAKKAGEHALAAALNRDSKILQKSRKKLKELILLK